MNVIVIEKNRIRITCTAYAIHLCSHIAAVIGGAVLQDNIEFINIIVI